ncbi:ester cyclase [Embleya sp. NPDC020630]|uniref:ester cyclase n=1 Tax=Embleya sp. NPDC020630 TaxID=3363979 RepID=UPI0037BD8225
MTTSDSGTPRGPAEVARAVFEALNDGDLDCFALFSADDVFDDFIAVGEFRGAAAVRAFFAELLAAVPDFSITVEDVIADAHGAAVKWHATGTFTGGPFQGVVANGRRIDLRGVDFMEIDDGRVQRNRIAYDGATFARQVGLLPPTGSGPDRALLAAFNRKTRLTQWWQARRRATTSH